VEEEDDLTDEERAPPQPSQTSPIWRILVDLIIFGGDIASFVSTTLLLKQMRAYETTIDKLLRGQIAIESFDLALLLVSCSLLVHDMILSNAERRRVRRDWENWIQTISEARNSIRHTVTQPPPTVPLQDLNPNPDSPLYRGGVSNWMGFV
jgi:hypothetical protein